MRPIYNYRNKTKSAEIISEIQPNLFYFQSVALLPTRRFR